jgi:hypothetical protein
MGHWRPATTITLESGAIQHNPATYIPDLPRAEVLVTEREILQRFGWDAAALALAISDFHFPQWEHRAQSFAIVNLLTPRAHMSRVWAQDKVDAWEQRLRQHLRQLRF